MWYAILGVEFTINKSCFFKADSKSPNYPFASILPGILTTICLSVGVAGCSPHPPTNSNSSSQSVGKSPTTTPTMVQKPAASPQQLGAPSETVREFYRALREKRFRDAFAMSIYKPAIEPLTPAEFEELRPDFERNASSVPENFEIKGEQISGDVATVFVKMLDQTDPITLIREGGKWIVGDKKDQAEVKRHGKEFFFKKRIEVHHIEVEDILNRINSAEVSYFIKSNGKYADLQTLINSGLIPKDIEAIGYRFTLELSKDAKSYKVTAEPLRYGRTGTYSYTMDPSGIKKKDGKGGK